MTPFSCSTSHGRIFPGWHHFWIGEAPCSFSWEIELFPRFTIDSRWPPGRFELGPISVKARKRYAPAFRMRIRSDFCLSWQTASSASRFKRISELREPPNRCSSWEMRIRSWWRRLQANPKFSCLPPAPIWPGMTYL